MAFGGYAGGKGIGGGNSWDFRDKYDRERGREINMIDKIDKNAK